jgi:glycerophosphoryl diester phosphodiesterase
VSDAPSIHDFGPDRPIYIAHRGAASLAPENTTEAYRAAHASGLRVLEQDVQLLRDGALCVMHDFTVDRTTTGTGEVRGFDRASWRALRIAVPRAMRRRFPDPIAPPLFADVLEEFKGRALFVPEAKSPGSGAALVEALRAAQIPTAHALVQAFAMHDLVAAVAAGYPAMFLTQVNIDIDAAREAGVTWVGIKYTAPDEVFSDWIAAGFKTVAYTVDDRTQRDRLLALGVSGFFSDDPIALQL